VGSAPPGSVTWGAPIMLLSALLATNRREPAPAINRSKAAVDPVAAFKLRCEARAHLYSQGELDLHDAADGLEGSAKLGGLNRTISRDAVQAIMAEAFRAVREKEWAADVLQPPPTSESAPSATTTASTIEALLFELRSGLSCLADAGAYDRLKRCDEAAMLAIAKELLGWKDRNKPWLPVWSREDLETLIDVWREIT
jgi:hypothetical protein